MSVILLCFRDLQQQAINFSKSRIDVSKSKIPVLLKIKNAKSHLNLHQRVKENMGHTNLLKNYSHIG